MCKRRGGVFAGLFLGAIFASIPAYATPVPNTVFKYESQDGTINYSNVGCPESARSCTKLFSYIESSSGVHWSIIFRVEEGVFYRRHATKAVRNGAIAEDWILFDRFEPVGLVSGKVVRSQVSYWMANCEKRTYAIGEFALYAGSMGSGEVVGSSTSQAPVSWERALPGSVGETVITTLCAETASDEKPVEVRSP